MKTPHVSGSVSSQFVRENVRNYKSNQSTPEPPSFQCPTFAYGYVSNATTNSNLNPRLYQIV
jgi:hypothetical protein